MTRPECMKMLRTMPVVSSHCHHALAEQHADLDLSRLLNTSYAGWCGVPVGETTQARAELPSRVTCNPRANGEQVRGRYERIEGIEGGWV